MEAFLRRFIESKKYIYFIMIFIFFVGVIYGYFAYQFSSSSIINFLKKLFYLNNEQYSNDYQLYFIQNCLYILICTYLSSSYIGHLGILFMVFIKGIQIIFSLIYVFSIIEIQLLTILLIIIEILIEIIFIFMICSMSIYLSLYVTFITFYIEQNLHLKNTINFRLNYLIAVLLIFSLSLAMRLYFIPLF